MEYKSEFWVCNSGNERIIRKLLSPLRKKQHNVCDFHLRKLKSQKFKFRGNLIEKKNSLPPPISRNLRKKLCAGIDTFKHSSTYFKTFMVISLLKNFLSQKVVWKIAQKRCFSKIFTPPCRNTHILRGPAQDVNLIH